MVIIQSVERAFEILRALTAGPARISELSPIADLPKSTVARMLFTLERVGAVTRIGTTNEYRLGDGLAQQAPAHHPTASLLGAVRPHLHRLSDAIGEAAGFNVPEGEVVHYPAPGRQPTADPRP